MGDILEIPKRALGTIMGNPLAAAVDPVGTATVGGLSGPSVQSVNAPASPDTPKTLLDPTQMPTLADQRNVKRKSMATQLARKGRASTILTQDDSLGASG